MEKRLDPRIRIAWLGAGLLVALVFAALSVILAVFDAPTWVFRAGVGLALVVAFVSIATPLARYASWRYLLTDTELLIRSGIFTKVERWVPRTRVQYVDVTAGPLDRALGLAALVVYTAGTGLRSASIPGLPTSEAERLREELLAWTREPEPEPTES